jgi:MoaA/NifB/PqqE/SkfB family radical SAM enzyme
MTMQHEDKELSIWDVVKEFLLGFKRIIDCIQVEVTSHCISKCTYCPHTVLKDQWQNRHMSLQTFQTLWPILRNTTRIHLQGWGEPLLNKDFFVMTQMGRKAGCAVSTTTCGLFMDEEIAKNIVNSGIDIVAFSLVGTDEASNGPRQGASFDQVCNSIECLQKIRHDHSGEHLGLHFAYLMLASQMEATLALPKLIHKLAMHGAVISTLDYIPSPEHATDAIFPYEEEKIAKATSILTQMSQEANALDVDIHWDLPKPSASPNCKENAERSLYIASDGTVSPCIFLNLPTNMNDPNRRIFGNVNTQNPLEIWHSNPFKSFRLALNQTNPDSACINCPKHRR